MALGVYVHIPYCVKKCPYCDFNSYGVGDVFPENEYTDSLLKELEMYAEVIDGEELTSIFFGGGTPSLFDPRNIERIITKINSYCRFSSGTEVSLEINPETADREKLRGLKQSGVNRLSFGVQSFYDKKLNFLGRINNPEDTKSILEDATKEGFDNFNIDLMYGTPVETLKEWENDLVEALRFTPSHISAYCLMIEDGTIFSNLQRRGKLTLPDDDYLSEIITFTTEYLQNNGYGQYEISNYSHPDLECRHNLLYWQGESYLGVGAGAHSHIKTAGSGWGERRGNIKNPGLYVKSVQSGEKPTDFSEQLEMREALEDKLLMGLRLNEGLELASLTDYFGVKPDLKKVDYLVKGGLLNLENDSVSLTGKGTLVSNAVIEKVLDALE